MRVGLVLIISLLWLNCLMTTALSGYGDPVISPSAPDQPIPSIADSSTETSFSVSWKQEMINNCTITKYVVNWSQSIDTGVDSGELDADKRDYTIENLKCNTNYEVRVTAYTSPDKSTESKPVTGITKDQAPGKTSVKELSLVADNPNQLSATWDEPDYQCSGDLQPYTVTWTAEGDDKPTGNKSVDGIFTTIIDLLPCKNYTISVFATSNTGKPGEPGTTISAETTAQVPEKSSKVNWKSFTSYSLEVDWNPPSNLSNPCPIINYEVEYAAITSDKAKLKQTVLEPPLNITSLDACTNYTITVIAKIKEGLQSSSDLVTLTTGNDAPPITEVNITPESRTATVTWERPDTRCELKFDVEYSGTTLWTNNQTADIGDTQLIDSKDPDALSITTTLDDLLPYSDYSVCVRIESSTNDDGDTTCNTFITTEADPSPPWNVSCENITEVSATVTWQFPMEENGILSEYVVYWELEGGDSNNYYKVNASITSHTISDLTKGNYSFMVSASNNKGSSDMSEPIYMSIDGTRIPPPTPCDGGCIAGIVIAVLVVALAVPSFIYREKIIEKIKSNKNFFKRSTRYLQDV